VVGLIVDPAREAPFRLFFQVSSQTCVLAG
jgi:hypothetical protein